MNENEKPALGTSEAAVLACVDLIARAVQVSEERVSYYLDLYYQLRSRYEAEHEPPKADATAMMVRCDGEQEPAGETAGGSKKNRS